MSAQPVDVLAVCRGLKFEYTQLRRVIHTVPVDLRSSVEVVGDGDNACYEWVILTGAKVERHSNCGYGCPSIALRDGLAAFHGLPGDMAATKPCDCRARMDEKLLPHNLKVATSFGVVEEPGRSRLVQRVNVMTTKLDTSKRSKSSPLVLASFCPFCGQSVAIADDADRATARNTPAVETAQ